MYYGIVHQNISCFFVEQIDTLETQVIRNVESGSLHNVAMTETGQLLSWGDNTHGQLGRGYTDEQFSKTPK